MFFFVSLEADFFFFFRFPGVKPILNKRHIENVNGVAVLPRHDWDMFISFVEPLPVFEIHPLYFQLLQKCFWTGNNYPSLDINQMLSSL